MKNYHYSFLLACILWLVGAASVYAISVSNDVTLTIPATPAGATANVVMRSGSSFSSLTVTATNFTITLGSGDTVTLDSSEGKLFTNDQSIATACGESSSIVLTADKTYVISMGGGCVLSGGGGAPPPSTTPPPSSGGGTVSSPPVTPAIPATPATPATPTEMPATPATPATPALIKSPVFNSDLQFGDEGEAVLRLQELLASDPEIYPEKLISGYYGSLTRAAVRRFQTKHGLPAVGRVGPQTRAKLAEVFSSPVAPSATPPPAPTQSSYVFMRELSFGMEGEDIAQLQLLLANDRDVYPEGTVTGYYGSLTRAAVKRFQTKNSLPAVGRVGPQTLAKLNSLASPAGGGSSSSAPVSDLEALEQKMKAIQDAIKALETQ